MEVVKYAQRPGETLGSIEAGSTIICAQWPFEVKERYTGNFGVETRNPNFFVG